MKIINYVCSLGNRCHSAYLLKQCGLKKASYPFDWIFSDLDMIIHCIGNKFNVFLDKQYYTSSNISLNKQKHDLYKLNEEDYTFNHHNPLNKKDYEYFQRCCLRLFKLFEKPETKMFLLMFLNYSKMDELFISKIEEFNYNLCKFTNNYGLLCIINYKSDQNSYKITKKENIHFLELNTLSYSNGKEFERKEDNEYLQKILTTTYQFELLDIEEVNLTEEKLVNDNIYNLTN